VDFLDAAGNVRCDGFNRITTDNFADWPYFKLAVAQRAFAIGEYQIGRLTGVPSLNFGMPVLDNQGVLKGVAFAALDLKQLDLNLKIATTPDGSVTVTDRQGTIVATDVLQKGRIGSRYPDTVRYSAMKTRPAGVIDQSDAKGVETLYAIAAVGGGSQPSLFVIASIAREAVTGPARQELVFVLFLFTLWAALGVAAARWVGNRTLVTPTRRLLGDINALAGDDALHTASPGLNVDELGALSSAFHRVAVILKLRQAERDRNEARLRETQKRLLNAQRIGKIGNWEFDPATREFWWSDQTYAIFEQTPQNFAVSFTSLSGQVCAQDFDRCEEARRNFLAGNAGLDIEYRIATGTGRVRRVHALGEMRPAGQELGLFSGTVQDITDRVRNELLLACEALALKSLSLDLPLEEVLAELLTGLETILPGSLTMDNLLSTDSTRLKPGAAPSLPKAYSQALDGLLVGPCAGSCGTGAYRRESVIVTDIQSDPLWADHRELAQQHGLQACWSIPVLDRTGHVLATFAVYYREPHTPDPQDLNLAHGAASVIGIAIEGEMKDAALRASEKRFRNTFASAATGMTITTLAGHYVEVNAACCRMFGYTAEELFGRDIKSFIHPDDRHKYSSQMHELEEGSGASYIPERRFIVKDSRVVWIRSSVSALRDASGKVVARAAIAEDITLQREAEDALLKTQSLLSLVSRISRQGAWQVDLPDQRLIWSEEVYAIHELPQSVTPVLEAGINHYAPDHKFRLVLSSHWRLIRVPRLSNRRRPGRLLSGHHAKAQSRRAVAAASNRRVASERRGDSHRGHALWELRAKNGVRQ
jgi:PAS domain S-box-containing protein